MNEMRRLQTGFTLFETILVIGLLALVSAGLLAMHPRIFQTQTTGRDEYVAHELQRACAERVLAVRRRIGYANVSTDSCQPLGIVGGFTPAVALTIAGSASSPCGGASCKALITVTRSGVAAALPAITLELSAY
jgi:type II secretory pathway component PulJ